MATEKVDGKVFNKKEKWLNSMQQLIKPTLSKRTPREVDVDDANPNAMYIDPYTKILDSTGGVNRERYTIGRIRGTD